MQTTFTQLRINFIVLFRLHWISIQSFWVWNRNGLSLDWKGLMGSRNSAHINSTKNCLICFRFQSFCRVIGGGRLGIHFTISFAKLRASSIPEWARPSRRIFIRRKASSKCKHPLNLFYLNIWETRKSFHSNEEFHRKYPQIPEIQIENQSRPPSGVGEWSGGSAIPVRNTDVNQNSTTSKTMRFALHFGCNFSSCRTPFVCERLFRRANRRNHGTHPGTFSTDWSGFGWCPLIVDSMGLILGFWSGERIDGILPRYGRWQYSRERPETLWAKNWGYETLGSWDELTICFCTYAICIYSIQRSPIISAFCLP